MSLRPKSQLNPKKHYLQVALNSNLYEAEKIIRQLPVSDRIIIEVGTPLIKEYGIDAIRKVRSLCGGRSFAGSSPVISSPTTTGFASQIASQVKNFPSSFGMTEWLDALKTVQGNLQNFQVSIQSNASGEEMTTEATAVQQEVATSNVSLFTGPYIVADLKTMDRADTEVELAARGGANAAIALANAPIETLNAFIAACEKNGLDAMIDMMNVDFPLSVLGQLKKLPAVVIVHRGVDEEKFNREKQIPFHEIQRIKGRYNIMLAIAGGDSIREVQRAIFNNADIVVIWKEVYQSTQGTSQLINDFLKVIK